MQFRSKFCSQEHLDSTIILTDNTNIDLSSSSTTCDIYEQILHTFQLSFQITKPTRKGKTLIDHISSNICKNKIIHSDVLPCLTISEHDAPYIIVNIPTNEYEICYKFMRNLKHFDVETFINDFTKSKQKRYKIKKAIKEKKTQFYRKVLS